MATVAAIRQLLAESRRVAGGATSPLLGRLREDPSRILGDNGQTPDGYQTGLLRSSDRRVLLLASRQVGKSRTAGALALREALLNPGSLTLLLSPSLRQSGELFRAHVLPLYNGLGRPLEATQETALQLTLGNGSRVVSLPGEERTVRSFSAVRLLVIDEAARVPDSLYMAVRPMLAVSDGALLCLSSAYAKQGFFYEAWRGAEDWKRVKVPAADCPRISRAFLAEERAVLGNRLFDREYGCEFTAADDAVFDPDAVARALAAPATGARLF